MEARGLLLKSDNPDHILVVDDDRDIREFLSTYLAKNGLRVTVAPSGRHMRAALDGRGRLRRQALLCP